MVAFVICKNDGIQHVIVGEKGDEAVAMLSMEKLKKKHLEKIKKDYGEKLAKEYGDMENGFWHLHIVSCEKA